MIDVNLQTDLANKEERNKIRDAKDKVKDVAITVKDVIDKGNVGGIKENYVNNRFATRGANAVEDDPTLSKMLNELKAKNLSEDEAKEVIIATVKKMYEANGFTGVPDIKFEDVINGNTIGARGEETGTIYINVEKVIKDMGENGVGSLVGLIAHESSHSEKYTETTGIKGIEEGFADSKGDLANKKYDGTDKLLDTEKKDKDGLTEREKALKELEENFAGELAYSENLEADSFNEEVENQNASDGSRPATLQETIAASFEITGKLDKTLTLIYGGDVKIAAKLSAEAKGKEEITWSELKKELANNGFTKSEIGRLENLIKLNGSLDAAKTAYEWISLAHGLSKIGQAEYAAKNAPSYSAVGQAYESEQKLLEWNGKTTKTLIDNVNSKVKATVTADEVNKAFISSGYTEPPYKPGTTVFEIELKQDTKFVRVYDGKESFMTGGWMMKESDIKGLSPKEIKDKFALPEIPKYIVDVTVGEGTKIRTGIANKVDKWGNGGGTQFDMMGQRTQVFSNERNLK